MSYSPEDEARITAILSADIITRGIPTKTQEAPKENCLGMLNINNDEFFIVRLSVVTTVICLSTVHVGADILLSRKPKIANTKSERYTTISDHY